MWGGHFVMPYGRLDLQTKVPDEPMAWVMGAFGISRDLGFGVVHWPVRHQATRPFYLRLEAPSDVVKGEQIGIRVTLYNFWQQNLEVCVYMCQKLNDKMLLGTL
ncbi:hypothetical protein LSH36_224g01036 [Paralvinella palmiformis]|uniref:Alpha-2-macroglobulin domain-containing protein n=1 Tax=Paralvinella palmiformis TaxID=53620 RepID=A0AAD9JMT1_9ANNE|nr:hypothetical protein LSH36_224g01036 [Paralvinella palmiformis]